MIVGTNRIFPIILSGGAGTRLWPLSRESRPKQLLPLTGETTLLQQTALRVADSGRFEPLTVIGSLDHRFLIAEQLRQIDAQSPTIVLEPVPRNTGAAAAVGALLARRSLQDALLLIMPADHCIENVEAFLTSVDAGIDAASGGALVLFGMKPNAPSTGYGYIRAGQALAGAVTHAVRPVAAFVEKPDRKTAEGYLQSGEYLWNSGIFLLCAATLLAELSRHEPEILRHAEDALERSIHDSDFLRLDETAFRLCPSLSIDHAVMERTQRAAVVSADFGWTDVGSWSTLWDIANHDSAGNVLLGDVLVENTTGSYIRSEGPLVATIGVDDLVVVATADAVLVAQRRQDQEVRNIVDRLRAENLGRN